VGLVGAGAKEVRVYTRQPRNRTRGSALANSAKRGEVVLCETLLAAVGDAAWIVAAVPAAAALEVARQVCELKLNGTFYIDVASAAPSTKVAASRLIEEAGGCYVDAAILGSVVTAGLGVPVYASGAGAHGWSHLVSPLGMNVTIIDGPPGSAAQLKLVRSVYLKGRDALVAEMLIAARRLGITEQVLQSIAGPGEEVPFDVLAGRLMSGLVVHAERRASELRAAAKLLEDVGVTPAVTLGAVGRLNAASAIPHSHQRPHSLEEALEALDSSW